jgi:tetratricopeptide (TPR) repeat protein
VRCDTAKELLLRSNLDRLGYPRATQILRQALSKKPDEYSAGYLVATAGMLSMRLGNVEDGIASYRAVISAFKKQGNQSAEASATAFLALEAARAGSPLAVEFIKQAEDLTRILRYAPEAKVVLERAKVWQAAVALRISHPG